MSAPLQTLIKVDDATYRDLTHKLACAWDNKTRYFGKLDRIVYHVGHLPTGGDV